MKTPISKITRHAAVFTLLLALTVSGAVVSDGVTQLYAESSADKSASKTAGSDIDGMIEYVVAKGDTLYGISRKFGVSVDDICKANDMTKSSVLKAGKKIYIPLTNSKTASDKKDDSSSTKPSDATKTDSNTANSSGSGTSSGTKTTDETKTTGSSDSSSERKYDTYTVQKGDTFWHIAQINDMTVDELKKLNNLKEESTLKAGQKLKIPATIVDTSKAELPDLPSADPRTYTEKKVDPNVVWPVKKPSVTYVTGKVSGVQLTAGKNEAVTAIRAGTVTSCGNYRGFGNVVFVLSKTGLVYAYGGLGSVKVTRGQYVVFGDTIGTAGNDSIKGTPQILFMVYQKGMPMDPAKAPRG